MCWHAKLAPLLTLRHHRASTVCSNLLPSPKTTSPQIVGGLKPHTRGRCVMRLQGFRPLTGSRRSTVPVALAFPGPPPPPSKLISKRAAQLLEFSDGWTVDSEKSTANEAMAGQASSEPRTLDAGWSVSLATTSPARQAKSGKKGSKKAARSADQLDMSLTKTDKKRSGYVPLRSDQGILGLTLLQHQLHTNGTITAADRAALKIDADAAAAARKKARLAIPAVVHAAGRRGRGRDDFMDDDMMAEEEEDELLSDRPQFGLTFDEGSTELVDYDEFGNAITVDGFDSEAELNSDDNEEEDAADALDYGNTDGAVGWDQFGDDLSFLSSPVASTSSRDAGMTDSDVEAFMRADEGSCSASGATASTILSALPKRGQVMQRYGSEEQDSSGMMADDEFEEQDDWGLEEVDSKQRHPSLMHDLGVVGSKGSDKARDRRGADLDVQWGGTGTSASGIDFDEQEALLSRLFKPHRVKQLMAQQHEVAENLVMLRSGKGGLASNESRLHLQLRIIAGSAAGRKLLSSRGETTRPMMEKVRKAIFSMVQNQVRSANGLPPSTRWLDLFAGTGSVGLEALSRGAGTCHFVEMDSWVTKKVLSKNIAICSCAKRSVIHTTKAEDFLRKALATPRFAGGPFDVISVCPPYLKVSYPELFGLLDKSPLLHSGTVLFVEYPKQLSNEVPDALGPLSCVRNRKYGRTLVAVYAALKDENSSAGSGDDDDELSF